MENLPRRLLKFVGWSTDSSSEHPIINLRFKFIAVMSFTMALESLLNFKNQMLNVDRTFSAFEEFQGVVLYACIMGDLWLRPKKYCYLFRLLDGSLINYEHENCEDKTDNKYENKKESHFAENMLTSINLVYAFIIPLPSWITIINLLFYEKLSPSEYETLPLPWFHSLLFIKIESYLSYTIIVTLQTVYTILFVSSYCNCCLFMSNSMAKLASELHSLAFHIRKLGLIKSNSIPQQSSVKLSNDLRRLVDHHVAIIRSVEESNDALNFSMIMYNQVLCLHISTTLYRAVESEDLSQKFSFICGVVLSIFVLYVLCYAGQQLADESEEVSEALMESPWLDKSESFKRSLRIMMIISKKPLQLRPARLYSLDYRTCLTVLQASYSYFNLMQSVNH